jgi:pyruvate dehydrogenase E1 component
MIDIDPIETKEWLEALASLVEVEGIERASFILDHVLQQARALGVSVAGGMLTEYVNTIPVDQTPPYPGDIAIEHRILALLRWNAIVMVLKAGKYAPELGGHIASYASAAMLYEVGFNHFFKAQGSDHGGDLLYIQGHSSPGIYARGFLEGRFTAAQLSQFRQEVAGKGVSSYPHPWLMPDYWQFATVSMGLASLFSIYQARFLRYLQDRNLCQTRGRKVWVFCGDGEMDEPESLGALSVAAREQLDNLIFVVNCNLQRLDGPVRGNGKVVQELEGVFRGAGWNVIKVLWGSGWDPLLAKDTSGLLRQRMNEVIDGEFQCMAGNDGAYLREHFFGKYPELLAMVADYTDDQLKQLQRGGHDLEKIYAAYHRATVDQTKPTVILAHTVKGYGRGAAGEAQNITHQKKKLTPDDLKAFRARFNMPVTDEDIEHLNFVKPPEDSDEIRYIKKQRAQLNGYLPARRQNAEHALTIPGLDAFASLFEATGEREISTTMAFVRILNILLKDKALSSRIVPIVPDESRTFGMEGLFRQIGIYSPVGQLYHPEDAKQLMYYREAVDGQILEEGISEAGAFSSWLAAATSYSVSNYPMIPFYIYYSMFGFQRVGDLSWAAGDMQARGFLLGATAGRTTLAGEGLQHQDGHSHILANTIPNCRCYDPAFAGELAVIIQHGLKCMFEQQENVFYYITLMNENYSHPACPADAVDAIIKGMYQLQTSAAKTEHRVQLLGSGTILREVLAAATVLEKEYGVAADVWSVTSFTELRRDGLDVERHNRLHLDANPRVSYVTECLQDRSGPVIAATDYMKAHADQIRLFVPQKYHVLGTDGYGRSDTRQQLRDFFEVNWQHVVYASLAALASEGKVSMKTLKAAREKLKIDPHKPNPVNV